MPNRLRTTIVVIVSVVWGANFMAPLFMLGYHPAPELNVAFMAIVGALTASYRDEDRSRRRKSPRLTGKHRRDRKER